MKKYFLTAAGFALGTLLYGLLDHQLNWQRATFVGAFVGLGSWFLDPWLARRR